MTFKVMDVGTITKPVRSERHWIKGKVRDLEVYQIPLEHLYFNIENGRYADRMIKLRHEHPNEAIDPRADRWKEEIEKMLAGEHQDTGRDKGPFDTLLADMEVRDQLRPGVVLSDGGVIDGNRRLATLRRLRGKHTRSSKFRHFDAVILPEDTTKEDRWRIEAGLQLGTNERWDYSPVNEMLKIREGVDMYREMITRGSFNSNQSPVKLVAQAIYGKTENEIQEMLYRLRLIDEYLQFVEQEGAYHEVGATSERFKEANRIIIAAENQQVDPKTLAKLKSAIFYLIDQEVMDNWDLRKVYDAMGGDPKKGGPKKQANMTALKEFLNAFPDPAEVQQSLKQAHAPVEPAPTGTDKRRPEKSLDETPRKKKAKPAKPTAPSKPPVDKTKVEAAAERFKRVVDTTGKTRSLRKTVEGARGSLQALETDLSRQEVRDNLNGEERSVIVETLESMQQSIGTCLGLLRPKRRAKVNGRQARTTS